MERPLPMRCKSMLVRIADTCKRRPSHKTAILRLRRNYRRADISGAEVRQVPRRPRAVRRPAIRSSAPCRRPSRRWSVVRRLLELCSVDWDSASAPPVGVPPLGPLLSDQPILMMPNFSPDAFHTTFRLHQSITAEVGDDGPITSIGGFFPHTTANGLWFIDGQFNLLEDALNPGEETENFGSNLGIGWRRIVPELDAIAGISFWYDLDRTRPDFVHQAAISGELLGDVWQLRATPTSPAARIELAR